MTPHTARSSSRTTSRGTHPAASAAPARRYRSSSSCFTMILSSTQHAVDPVDEGLREGPKSRPRSLVPGGPGGDQSVCGAGGLPRGRGRESPGRGRCSPALPPRQAAGRPAGFTGGRAEGSTGGKLAASQRELRCVQKSAEGDDGIHHNVGGRGAVRRHRWHHAARRDTEP